jgi:hypothetical protein
MFVDMLCVESQVSAVGFVTCKIYFPEVHPARMLYELELRMSSFVPDSQNCSQAPRVLRLSISDTTVD